VRWIAIAFAALVVTVAAWVTLRPVPAASTEVAGSQPAVPLEEIRSISLEGDQLPQARLRQVLATRPGERLDPDHLPQRLERDRAAMERQLADLGFLAARVAPPIVTRDPAGAAYVIFEVDQGPLFHLRTIEVTGAARDAAVVTLTPGDPAIRDRIENAREALADGLLRRGTPATVELSVRTDLAAAAVDVVLSTRVATPQRTAGVSAASSRPRALHRRACRTGASNRSDASPRPPCRTRTSPGRG
jgi:Surface antigen variable number repeat